ncbi:DinB family protein [Evansella halocellulosilytica]|uniref:DinB family protein n=1 Tax=Evansella halocellulosilytica TaxID=2011013 RepID=UPI000BB755C7|nr:DinB family protein [Evansella halocellulosilytica]
MQNNTLSHFEGTIVRILELKDVTESELCEPIREEKWSIREIVGHMYSWDQYNLEQMVPNMSEGNALPPFPDHDEFNESAMSQLENVPVDEIIETFVRTRKKLIQYLMDLGDVRFTIGKGKRQFSPESFIKIFLKHDQHHLKQIEEKLS